MAKNSCLPDGTESRVGCVEPSMTHQSFGGRRTLAMAREMVRRRGLDAPYDLTIRVSSLDDIDAFAQGPAAVRCEAVHIRQSGVSLQISSAYSRRRETVWADRWLGQNAPGTWAYYLLEALLWWSYAPPQPPTPTQAREHNGVAGAECPRDATEASSVSQALRTGGWGRMPQGQEPRTALLWCRCAPPQPPLLRGRKASIQERGSSGSVQSSRSPSRQALWPELSPP
jgi:hypothetical protein